MDTFVSMTRTLTATYRSPGLARQADAPDTRFVFACTRGHVLGDTETAPYEITWIDDDTRSFDRVQVADLSPARAAHWAWFRDVIETADAQGRVWWGAGRGTDEETNAFIPLAYEQRNYPGMVEALQAAGHVVIAS